MLAVRKIGAGLTRNLGQPNQSPQYNAFPAKKVLKSSKKDSHSRRVQLRPDAVIKALQRWRAFRFLASAPEPSTVLMLSSMMRMRGLLLFLSLAPGFVGTAASASGSGACSGWLDSLGAKWAIHSPGKPYSVSRVPRPSRNGGQSLRFELRGRERWEAGGLSSFRAEVDTHEHVPMESAQWYGFSIELPKDFPLEDNRLVLAQWWAMPKKGEVHRSPVLALRFSEGKLSLLLRYYAERIVRDPDGYRQKKLLAIDPLPLGVWNDFVFHVKWSPTADGFIEAWRNGEKILDYKGITGNQDEIGPAFKFGLYRDGTDKTYVGYFGGYRMGDSYAAVDPAAPCAAVVLP